MPMWHRTVVMVATTRLVRSARDLLGPTAPGSKQFGKEACGQTAAEARPRRRRKHQIHAQPDAKHAETTLNRSFPKPQREPTDWRIPYHPLLSVGLGGKSIRSCAAVRPTGWQGTTEVQQFTHVSAGMGQQKHAGEGGQTGPNRLDSRSACPEHRKYRGIRPFSQEPCQEDW